LLIRGRKLVGSLLKVIARLSKNLFMPESKDDGLRTKFSYQGNEKGYAIPIRPCVYRGGSVVHNYSIRKVSCHDKVVLDNEGGFLGMENETRFMLNAIQPSSNKISYRLITFAATIRCSESRYALGSSIK
jgi:hypothetical protein